jgi:aminopeptidase N
VRPESAYSTENFYTATIYEKGSELIHMIETIIGREKFQKGISKYFEIFDGQAVTTEDFVRAMEIASGADLTQFRLWYSQAGTPRVEVRDLYDAATKTYTLKLRQSIPNTPGQTDKKPMHIPVRLGLLSRDGRDMIPEQVLAFTQGEQSFEFKNVAEKPLPSLFRDFSAPVIFDYPYTEEDDLFLLAKDTNLFNRWEAAQRLYVKSLLGIYAALEKGAEPVVPTGLIAGLKKNIEEADRDPLFVSRLVQIPSARILEQSMKDVNPLHLDQARRRLKKFVAQEIESTLVATAKKYQVKGAFEITPRAMGERALLGASVEYLCTLEKSEHFDLALKLYAGETMTEKAYAASALVCYDVPQARQLLQDFYAAYASDGVLVNRWISYAAMHPGTGIETRLKRIFDDPRFTKTNPNNNMSIWRSLIEGDSSSFHQKDGAAYRILADRIIELDAINPNLAARHVGPLENWRKYAAPFRDLMRAQLERVVAHPKLSSNAFELASNALKEPQA